MTGTSAVDIELKLNSALELVNVIDWLIADKLTLNVIKTKYMIIGSYKRITNIQNQNEINIRLGDKDINRTNSSKSLGSYLMSI